MEPVDLFYSYAHEDEKLRDELAGHLKIMERRGVIRPWHDRCIAPGQNWEHEIDTQLTTADLVLLLVSADFINSDYIWGHELDTAMQRHKRGEASVVPVMLRSVDIAGAPFADLKGLPTDLRPVTSWPNRDEAWTDVAKGIRRTVEHIQANWADKAPPMAAPSAPVSGKVMGHILSLPTNIDAISKTALELIAKAAKEKAAKEKAAKEKTARQAAPDPILDRVVNEFSAQVTEAAKARGAPDIDPAQAKRYALELIDSPDQKRILWVDDIPSGNHFETAALAKLQIEVVAVTSTDAALARIDSDPEGFDLVLSDWQRPEPATDAPSAGIDLLHKLRARHMTIPVVFYHGSFTEQERRARRDLALGEGAYGEAVMPDELLGLVVSALGLR